MTKIKLCGLSRLCDIEAANRFLPEYIGFVFASGSKRYVPPEQAAGLKKHLNSRIKAVGVFVNEELHTVAQLLKDHVIDAAQLHGNEEEEYIRQLRELSRKPVIKAFRIDTKQDILAAKRSLADYILLDSGSGGTGTSFCWELAKDLDRKYFLAGGLNTDNVKDALKILHPYAVDVSSGVETDGYKEEKKMSEFINAVRNKENR